MTDIIWAVLLGIQQNHLLNSVAHVWSRCMSKMPMATKIIATACLSTMNIIPHAKEYVVRG